MMPGRKILLWWTSSLPRRLSQVTLVFLNVGFPMAQFSIFWSFNVINKYLCTSEMERSARMTWIDFFSSLGGLSGLCLFLLLFTSMFHWVYFRWPLWTLSWVQCHILHWGFDHQFLEKLGQQNLIQRHRLHIFYFIYHHFPGDLLGCCENLQKCHRKPKNVIW